jgi:hypothetical protein
MTIKDRMLAVYHHRLPDQVPISIYSRYLPRGAKEREVRAMGMGIIEYHPVTTLLAPPWHLNPGFLSHVKGAEFSISYRQTDGKTVEVRTYKTKVGVLSQHTEKDPIYGSDWITKFYIESAEDYKVMQYIVENTVFQNNHKALKRLIEDLGEDGVVLGRIDRSPFQKLLIELAKPEMFLVDVCSEESHVLDLLATIAAKTEQTLDWLAESPAEIIWQPENITADMCPPRCFAKYCVPYYQKVATRLNGKPYMVHLDGKLKALAPLIKGCSFTGVESFSYEEMGNDLPFSEAAKAWPDMVILPNFPSSLCDKSEDEIKRFLDEKLREAGNAPFMIQISEDIDHAQWERVLPIVTQHLSEYGRIIH